MMQFNSRHSLLTAALCCAQGVWAAPHYAEIVGLSGKGEYRADGQSQWREAKLNTALQPADWVRTLEQSSMAILVEQTQVRLAANSLFQIKRDGPAAGTTLNLRQGRAWSQTKAPPTTLRMQTPSAIAAIHGTDWETTVDEKGKVLFTVLHGQVHVSNEHGELWLKSGEQAEATPDQAPVKRRISNPADRVQWVSSFRIDVDRYAEYRGDERVGLRDLVLKEQWSTLEWSINALSRQNKALPADTLLLADLAIVAGETRVARLRLEEGARKYPDDARFPAALSALALHLGEGEKALTLAREATERFPNAVPTWLTLGDAAAFNGLADEAAAAYAQALQIEPANAAARLGLGRIAAQRDDIAQARSHFLAARLSEPALPGMAGELGELETAAGRFATARQYFDAALQADGQDYLALGGLARLHLHEGENEAALDASLRASVLEPRHARAYVWRAVAHHRRGQSAVALEFLRQASERDARDPLPHFLASLILQDIGELRAAVAEAHQARAKLPWLKSLAPLAVDQKGRANLGSALASLDLGAWALHYARTSFDPLWAGSHFFFADRLSGTFNKNSALMQGYLSDPLAFGASPHRQSLLPTPGAWLNLAVHASRTDHDRSVDPSLVTGGLTRLGDGTAAWFVEALRNEQHHSGKPQVEASGNALTAALGLKPRHDLGFFLFANSYRPDIVERAANGSTETDGESWRVDAGGSLRFGPERQLWFKAGGGSLRLDQQRASGVRIEQRQDQHDLQLRYTTRAVLTELTLGAEWASGDKDVRIKSGQLSLPRSEQDEHFTAWLQARQPLATGWGLEGTLAVGDYCKDSLDSTRRSTRQCAGAELMPGLGLTWQASEGLMLRAQVMDWLRGLAPHSLRPVMLAGIPLDDQMSLPGGRQKRLRLQADWEATPQAFVTAFIDQRRIRNLGEMGDVQNTGEEVSDINRLRERGLWQHWLDAERLEAQPAFLQGEARRAGVSADALLGSGLGGQWSGSLSYIHSVSRNTGAWFRDFPLPYLPRHRASVGLNWSNEARLSLGGVLVWRSSRFSTEYGEVLPSGWDLALKARWESPDKRWLVEAWTANLLKKNSTGQRDQEILGIGLTWRY